MCGDRVQYHGSKFANQIKHTLGLVVAPVQNQEGTYVVEFGDDSYVMNGSLLNLKPYSDKEFKDGTATFVPKKKRFSLEDEESSKIVREEENE